jgi:hypothetical protein
VAEMAFLGRKSHMGKVNILKKWWVLLMAIVAQLGYSGREGGNIRTGGGAAEKLLNDITSKN